MLKENDPKQIQLTFPIASNAPSRNRIIPSVKNATPNNVNPTPISEITD